MRSQVFGKLARGEIYTHTVVIPEGFNIFEVAQAVQQAGLGTADDFLAATRAEAGLVRGFDPQATSLEGYLFPDTYQFTRTQSMHDMLQVMVRRFEQESRQIGLTENVHAVVTMASIVEKETAIASERPLVASVYYNRLQRHMPLAADPTVVYAALLNQRYRGAIYQSDLQFESALQHLQASRLAAWADCQSRNRIAQGRHESEPLGLPLLCRRRTGRTSIQQQFRGAYSQRGCVAPSAASPGSAAV